MKIQTKQDFILGLIESGLLSFEKVTSTSEGHVNPYYLDLRAIYSYPKLTEYAVEWLRGAVEDVEFDYICSIETASLPLVGGYGLHYMEPTLYLRTKKKAYGKQNIIEGHFKPGDKIILVDDLIVEPPVTLDFIVTAEKVEVEVVGLYVLYEKLAPELSRDVFESEGYPIKSLFTYKDIVSVLSQHHKELELDEELVRLVDEFGNTYKS